ncbi:protein DpdJ [Moritella dasanensis]|uniref:protein DpdJ n=1 Tax=Moritella dasanensis TaxID=428031 RepID=UPI0002E522B4|nr:protein DpdJ [Moritella dasanensis]
MSDIKTIMLKCLDELEERETKLLSWGDTDVSHTESELLDIITKHIGVFDSASEIIEEMLRVCFIFQVEGEYNAKLYRSRMAETVRLQVSSRQWFHGQELHKTKTLVSDFRFLRRPRRYPSRSEPSEKLIELLKSKGSINQVQSEIIDLLLTNGEHKFKLAGFQSRATERILEKYDQHLKKQFTPTASIICSGTGSGKTLSFYLPAVTQLASQLLTDSTPRVRILAIYPRNELLKDQFSETYSEVRKLDSFLQQRGCRKIRIGTYFGNTFDKSCEDNKLFNTLSCPFNSCGGKLHFKKAKNHLQCETCLNIIDEGEIGLTRQSQRFNPPDILFTTTEMLNQRLSDNFYNHLFGVKTGYTIPIVLMDEVHTYEGSSGAQVSYLLKRWMKRSNNAPHFVGLSATLDDAQQFFGDLTSTKKKDVDLIEPKESEMEEEGAEYMLTLKGDPVSQSALLSTTIQATMLASRMLDPLKGANLNLSDGIFGEKTFVFTDNLDVINRMYSQLYDAEGWYSPGYPKNKPSLAYLRSVIHSDYMRPQKKEERRNLGLEWGAVTKIGHDMSAQSRGNVARTSSQDSGVNNSSEIVVATASLEVGFNDPKVGAVIQHKAPRNMASYLQRKGRAGRKRGMRPWMYTILSDYGRDRVTFQQYERLISPKVKSFKLPVENSHIQKMQANVAIIDYLSILIPHIHVWRTLSDPKQNLPRLKKIKLIVYRWLEVDNSGIERYLKDALSIDDTTLKQVLWSSPRSVMMDFLPSLLHKLETNWAVNGEEWAGLIKDIRHPMPEFIPPNLFSELHTPSLYLILERGRFDNPCSEGENMDLFQGLKEFSPGRVSKRFAVDNESDTDWLVPEGFKPSPGIHTSINFDIEEAFYQKEHQQYITKVLDENDQEVDVYHPIKVKTQRIPSDKKFHNDPRINYNLSPTSNSFLRWCSDFRTPYDRGENMRIPQNCDWVNIISQMKFFMHDEINPVEVIRYTTGADSEIKFRNSKETSLTTFNWTLDSRPVAIGTRLFVDGIKVVFDIDDVQRKNMASFDNNSSALRFSYLEDSFVSNEVYKNNFFFAKWVFECVTAVLVILMEENNQTLNEAVNELSTSSGLRLLHSIPSEVFNMKESHEDDASGKSIFKDQELQEKLKNYFESREGIQEIQQALSAVNHNESNSEYMDWIKEVLGSTISGAMANLIVQVLPDVNDGSVVVDHYWSNDKLNIWLTESEIGGVGIISRFKDVYIDDPLSVMMQFSRIFDADENEQVDFDLYYLLNEKKKKPELASAFEQLRTSIGYKQRVESHDILNKVVSNTGVFTSHTWNTMLHTRVFKPGSNQEHDEFLSNLLSEWRGIEDKMGMEIPLSIISHILAKRHHKGAMQLSSYRNSILSLLWPRGNQIRQSRLDNYNRFNSKQVRTERLLLSSILATDAIKVVYKAGWEEKVESFLTDDGRCVLSISSRGRNKIGAILAIINTMVIDMGGLLIYPRVSLLKQSIGIIELSIEISEIIQ